MLCFGWQCIYTCTGGDRVGWVAAVLRNRANSLLGLPRKVEAQQGPSHSLAGMQQICEPEPVTSGILRIPTLTPPPHDPTKQLRLNLETLVDVSLCSILVERTAGLSLMIRSRQYSSVLMFWRSDATPTSYVTHATLNFPCVMCERLLHDGVNAARSETSTPGGKRGG